MLQSKYLWELCYQVVGNLHGVVKVVKYFCQFVFIGHQHLWNSNNHLLDLVFFESKLYFTHLWNTLTESVLKCALMLFKLSCAKF